MLQRIFKTLLASSILVTLLFGETSYRTEVNIYTLQERLNQYVNCQKERGKRGLNVRSFNLEDEEKRADLLTFLLSGVCPMY